MPEIDPNVLPTEVPAPPSGPFYTAEDIARVRQEEKDKLYSRLNTQGTKLNALEEQIKTWQTERDTAAQAETQRQAAEAEAARVAAQAEMSAMERLTQRETEWAAQLDAVRKESEQKFAVLEKDRSLAQLQSYIQRRVREEAENIAPELIDLIDGNTPDEVEAMVTLLKAKTDLILNNLQVANTQVTANMRGVSSAGYTASDGPLENQLASKTYSPEELRSMPMSEYAKLRNSLLGAASQTNGGLFG